jgi:hypothetical protein
MPGKVPPTFPSGIAPFKARAMPGKVDSTFRPAFPALRKSKS